MIQKQTLSILFGMLGGVGTTFSFLPQVIHVYRKPLPESSSINRTQGLSPYMLGIHFGGVSSWLLYGIVVHDPFVISFNSITLLMVSSIIVKYWSTFYRDPSIVNDPSLSSSPPSVCNISSISGISSISSISPV
jgi:uncharacterized protein with PQ loop repeat